MNNPQFTEEELRLFVGPRRCVGGSCPDCGEWFDSEEETVAHRAETGHDVLRLTVPVSLAVN
jgi:hypothetical protein